MKNQRPRKQGVRWKAPLRRVESKVRARTFGPRQAEPAPEFYLGALDPGRPPFDPSDLATDVLEMLNDAYESKRPVDPELLAACGYAPGESPRVLTMQPYGGWPLDLPAIEGMSVVEILRTLNGGIEAGYLIPILESGYGTSYIVRKPPPEALQQQRAERDGE